MTAMDPTYVVSHFSLVPIDVCIGTSAATGCKSSVDTEGRSIPRRRGNRKSEAGGRRQVCGWSPSKWLPGPSQVQTVNHVWGKSVGIARGHRLNHHVNSSPGGLKEIASVEERWIAVVGIEVSAKYAIACAGSPVNPSNVLIFITRVWNSDQEFSARITGRRDIFRYHECRRGIEESRVNLVSWKRPTGGVGQSDRFAGAPG